MLDINLLKHRFEYVMQFIQFTPANFPPAQFIYSESALLAPDLYPPPSSSQARGSL
jgi:hypothetical protein